MQRNRLREIRLLRNLTQADLAKSAGVSQPTVSDIERGDIVSPAHETVARLALALNVSIEELFPRQAGGTSDGAAA